MFHKKRLPPTTYNIPARSTSALFTLLRARGKVFAAEPTFLKNARTACQRYSLQSPRHGARVSARNRDESPLFCCRRTHGSRRRSQSPSSAAGGEAARRGELVSRGAARTRCAWCASSRPATRTAYCERLGKFFGPIFPEIWISTSALKRTGSRSTVNSMQRGAGLWLIPNIGTLLPKSFGHLPVISISSWRGGKSGYEHHQILSKMDPKNIPSVSPEHRCASARLCC